MRDVLLVLAQSGAPFSLRFVIQPLMAVLLGVRDGRRDAEAGRIPYFLLLLTGRARRETLANGLRSTAVPLALAVVLDGLVQFLVSRHVFLWKAVVTGILLIGLPYLASRGLMNRAASHHARRA